MSISSRASRLGFIRFFNHVSTSPISSTRKSIVRR